MPNARVPSLRRHRGRGYWFVRWGGKDHYLGYDQNAAITKYHVQLDRWRAWRDRVQLERARTDAGKHLNVMQLSELFIAAKDIEGGRALGNYYRKHLRRFMGQTGFMLAKDVRASHINDLRTAMLDAAYARKTCNHDVIAAKALLRWAMDNDYIPFVSLRAARQLPLGPPPDKTLPWGQIVYMVYGAPTTNMGAWLAVNYLTVARPSEVVSLVNRRGAWIEDGVFRLDRGKTDLKTSQPRCLVLTERAQAWLSLCRPRWSRLDSYSQAVRDAFGPGGPHPLRHSAATHLAEGGASAESIARLLGHVPPRVYAVYARTNWPTLRRAANLLRL